jgi:YidC/Oxa1 family membrane protein insertase
MEQNDQRNFLLAILLMGGVLFAYNMFILEPQARAQREARARVQTEQTQTNPTAPTIAATRPRDDIVREETAGGLRVALDAPSVDGSISLRGSRIDDVSLKGFYETIEDKLAQNKPAEVQLLSPESTDRAFYAVVNWVGNGLPDENTVWAQTSAGALTADNPLDLSWSGEGVRIERRITIDQNYMFTVNDTVTNTGAAPISAQPVAAIRQRMLADHLKPPPQAHAGAIGTYGSQSNQMRKYADLNKAKGVLEEVDRGWIGLTTKYWMAAAVPQQGEPVTMRASVDKSNGQTTFLAGYTASSHTIAPGQSVTAATRIFAGAKRVAVLDQYEKDLGIPSFTDAVDWSWLFFITKPFFWMLQAFQGWFGSFGLAILALTVVVKTFFFPLQWKMYQSMSKMRKVAPQMEEIRKRFAADRPRQQQEIMKLYQQEKVNPLAGCLPIIPQMFVFYALYHTLMVTIEMRHTPFYGWVKDMSAPDPTTIFNLFGLLPWDPSSIPFVGSFLMIGVWPVLYGLTMFALQGMSPPPTDPIQKAVMRWLPLIFLILFAGFAAGLVIYWVWSNVITIVQQYIIMRRNGVETEFDKFLKKAFGKKTESA